MRTGFITALVASGCLLGLQASARAQNLAEHPRIVNPSAHQHAYPAVPQYYDLYAPYPTQSGGVYDPYNDTYYPPDFRGPWH